MTGFQQFFVNIWDSIRITLIENSRWTLYFKGLGTTILTALGAAMIGVIIGLLVAFIDNYHENTGKMTIVNKFAKLYVTVIRGTPVLVQMFIMFFVVLSSISSFPIIIAIVTFGLNSGAYVSEIARAGINSVDKGQMEAGRSLGLSYTKTMRNIDLPQALKNSVPPIGNEFISLIKETSVIGYIGVVDITKAGSMIQGATFEAFMPLLVSAAIYLVLVIILTKFLRLLERRLRKSDKR